MSLKQTFTSKLGKRMLAGIVSAALIMTSSGMIPAKAAITEVTINADQITTYAVGGTVDGADVTRAKSTNNTSVANDIYYLNEIVTGDAEKNTQLVDGDTTTAVKYGASRVVIIDLGETNVSKVEIYGAASTYCVATSDVVPPVEITKGSPVQYEATAAVRLNQTEGYNISNAMLTYGDGMVTIAGVNFGRYLIIDANNTSADIAEVKAYEGQADEPAEPAAAVTIGEDGKIDLSTADVYAWKGTSAQADKSAVLYDGDTITPISTGNQAFTVFDLKKAYSISKIRLQATGTRSDDVVAVSNDVQWLTNEIEAKNKTKVDVLRINGTKQKGVEVISSVKSDDTLANNNDTTVGPVTPTSGDDTSGTYRFVIVYNWSATCQATELEVYTMTDEEIAAAALAKVKTDAKAELAAYLPEGNTQGSYTTENYALIETKRTEGNTAIDAATTEVEVATALANAKTAIDAVEAIQVSPELEQKKTEALTAINSAVNKESYDALAQNSIDAIVKDAEARLALADTNTEEKVTAIKEKAIENLQSLVTAEQVAVANEPQDAQLTNVITGNTGTNATIELRTGEEGGTYKDYVGLLKFPLDSGKKVKSAKLRLVTERAKTGSKEVKITNFDAQWDENNILNASSVAEDTKSSYDFLTESITASRSSSSVVTFDLASDGNTTIFDAADTTSLAAWTKEVDVTSLVADGVSEVNFLLSRENAGTNTCIFGKEYATYPNSNETNRSRYEKIQTVVTNAGEDMSYLAPTLIVEYENIVDEEAYYNVHFDNVSANVTDNEIVLPLYFDDVISSTHGVGGMLLRVYYDAEALNLKEVDVPRNTLGKEININSGLGNLEEDANGKYKAVSMSFETVLTSTTVSGQLMDFYFEPVNPTDNTKYDITVVSENQERWNVAEATFDGTDGHAIVTNGSITFGTPVVEKTALEKVNEAADAAALKAVIEDAANAAELGLDLTDYNALTNKDVVIDAVLAGKDYATAEALKTAFDAAVAAQKAAETPAVEYTLGDVNNDGTIGLEDALLALQMSVNSAITDEEKAQQPFLSADVNKSGTVTVDDVLLILKKANGKDVPELR